MKIKEKKVDALNTLKPSDKDIIPESAFVYEESRKELNKIEEIEKSVDKDKLIYKTFKHTYDFKKFKTIKTFGESIYNGKITLEETDECQSDSLGEIKIFYNKTRPQTFKKKQMKGDTQDDAKEMVLNGFKRKIFLTKSTGAGLFNTNDSKLKVLTPKQMLQRLPIALAQVKAGNNSENLLNEIRQIIYSLCQSKEITKKVCNNLMKPL